MGKSYAITGIPFAGRDPPTRQEIREWFKKNENKYQVSLFMQAMTEFKNTPITERLSFFQIAGIHCYPIVEWDGEKPVTEETKPTDNPFPGFCNHNMVTFPTWHRPYMLLYEQVIHGIMIGLISRWKKEGKLTDAKEEILWKAGAEQFRLPYWDWARKPVAGEKFAVPEICNSKYVEITLVGGKTDSQFLNPLVGFLNPGDVVMGDEKKMGDYAIKDNIDLKDASNDLPWSQCIGTSRFGINVDGPDSVWIRGVNDWPKVNEAMNDPLWYGQGSGSFTEAVSRLLSPNYFDSWESFASTVHNKPTAKYARHFMSLEYIHNIVHNTVGGTHKSKWKLGKDAGFRGVGLGHMSDVPVAAFDPIFWFHHCNIDRLTAFWQTLNPDKWFDKPQEHDPASNSNLRPFHRDEKSNNWTSDMCKNWTDLKYQYDDLVAKPTARNPDGSIDNVKYIADVRARVTELYPPTKKSAVGIVPGYGSDNTFDDYVINVIYDRYALNGHAYAILFFLGDAPEDLSTYRENQNFIGIVYTFSAPILDGEGCANCANQQAAKVLSKAQVPLTLPLLAKLSEKTPGLPTIGLGNFDQDTVDLFLKRSLNWKFVQLGGQVMRAEKFPNTEIAVLRGLGASPNHAGYSLGGEDKPLFSGYRRIEIATQDNKAGFAHDGTLLHLIEDDPEE